MTNYRCPRCGFETKRKNDMSRHFKRKNPCRAILQNVNTGICETLLNEKKLIITENGLNFKSDLEKLNDKVEKLTKILVERDNSTIKTKTNLQFIYLLQEREFLNSGRPIYKIGRTINPKNRLTDYPKGSIVLYLKVVEDNVKVEKDIMNNFDEHFTKRTDIGKEYYEGELFSMIEIINNCN